MTQMTHGRRTLLAGVAAGVVTVVAACGSRSPTISATATSELAQQVQAVRAAAVTGDRAEVETQLARLRAEVATLRTQHQITNDRAGQILSAASAVDTELATLVTTTTAPAATPTTAPRATPTTAPRATPTTTATSSTTQANGGKQNQKEHGVDGGD